MADTSFSFSKKKKFSPLDHCALFRRLDNPHYFCLAINEDYMSSFT